MVTGMISIGTNKVISRGLEKPLRAVEPRVAVMFDGEPARATCLLH